MNNAFTNKNVAITGKLKTMTRKEAYALIQHQQGHPVNAVSKTTHYLVVGMEGWFYLKDGRISNKLKRAETLQESGHRIVILSEPSFLEKCR